MMIISFDDVAVSFQRRTGFSLLTTTIIIISCVFILSSPLGIPRPVALLPPLTHSSSSSGHQNGDSDQNPKPFFYEQTLDHFNYRPESYVKFKQRYFMNSKFWGGPTNHSPIFVYFGAESSLDTVFPSIGFLPDNANRFKALLLYIEHRFYGNSVPYGLTPTNALKNSSIRGYLNSAQALADYAEVILHLKKVLQADYSPVIVIGSSYGGMLASWFRLKYPHVAHGALASSAPILYFDHSSTPQNGYYDIVSNNFKETSLNCYNTIKRSWSKIDQLASHKNGLKLLSKKFRFCQPLKSVSELKDYLNTIYATAAQYGDHVDPLVKNICSTIDGAPKENDILDKILASIENYYGNSSCYDFNEDELFSAEENKGWDWQSCSEIVFPMSMDENTMFQTTPFNLNNYIKKCIKSYGVSPRPNWITTYYGGHDIKSILGRFASNIIFSNGLRDPYSSGGVLRNISESVVAITTKEGSHGLDIFPASENDPTWLKNQRRSEIEIINLWLRKYYTHLHLNV